MKKMRKRGLALLLALLLCLALLPMAAFAEGGKAAAPQKDEKTEKVEKLGNAAEHDHVYAEGFTVDKEPSCAEQGSKSRHCTAEGCDAKTDVTEIDMVEHSYAAEFTVDKEPSCAEQGSKSRHCTIEGCDAKTDVTEIDTAVPHSYAAEFTVDKEPSCTEQGSKSRHCTVEGCTGKTDVTEIEAKGHTWDAATGTCESCEAECEHAFENGVCKTCGMEENTTAADTVEVTVRFNAYGTVSYGGKALQSGDKVSPEKGKDAAFVFTPLDEDCSVKSIKKDGTAVEAGTTSFRFDADGSLELVFVKKLDGSQFSAVVTPNGAQGSVYSYDISLADKLKDGTARDENLLPKTPVAFLIPYPDGTGKDSHDFKLVHKPDGTEVSLTKNDNGLLGQSTDFSLFELTVTLKAPKALTGVVTVSGEAAVGGVLTATVTGTNNSGTLSYRWSYTEGGTLPNGDKQSYTVAAADVGKTLICTVTSTVETGMIGSDGVLVRARPAAPTLTVDQHVVNDATGPLSKSGVISGVTTAMEFATSADAPAADWKAIEGTKLEVAQPGDYYVRLKAIDGVPAGESAKATVKAYYTITPVKGTGKGSIVPVSHTLESEGYVLVEAGGSATFRFPAESGWYVYDVKVDDVAVSVGHKDNLTVGDGKRVVIFTDVRAPHKLSVSFSYGTSSPKTGDSANFALWIGLSVAAIGGLAAVFFLYRRKNRQQ